MSCIDCEGSGRVWYRVGHSGVVGLMPCECKQEPDAYLDTRPEDRAHCAEGRRGDLLQLRAFELDQAQRHPTPERLAKIDELADRAHSAFDWQARWSQKAVA